MSDTFARKTELLKLIPRRAAGKSVQELRRGLQERGLEYSVKTIQRDLKELASIYQISCQDNPPVWTWDSNAQTETLPAHDSYSALTFRLIEDHLKPLLPTTIFRQLEPHFDSARGLLAQHQSGKKLDRWYKSVRVLPRALPLRSPDVDEEVLREVYQTLWDREELKVDYQSRGETQSRELILHPHALVLREGLIYLLATINSYTDIRHIAVHRILSAKNTYRDAVIQEDFDLDSYIESGAFSYLQGQPIDLVLRFHPYTAHHLLETPMADNQQHVELDDKRTEIRATVPNSQQLRWWLMGFGPGVEVVGPPELRQEMADAARAVGKLYA